MHKVNNASPERKKKSRLRSSNCRPEIYPWGMSSVINPFISFQSERGTLFLSQAFPLTLHEIPTTPTPISPCLSPSTHMSKFFFFSLKNDTKIIKQKYFIPFVIYISTFFTCLQIP